MYEDSRKKLERQLMLRRLGQAGIGALVALAIGAMLWFQSLDATVETRKVTGTIERIAPPMAGTVPGIENPVVVDVRLSDGRTAQVLVGQAARPAVGSAIEIAEHVHGTGRSNFSWK